MTATHEWRKMVYDVETAAKSMLAQLDQRERLLDALGDDDGAAKVAAADNRACARLQQLSERIAAAEQSAQQVNDELANAENELRSWSAQVGTLNGRLTAFLSN